jgi:UDP:flavonoid glycosyltransferase YjiC (YdhE family)
MAPFGLLAAAVLGVPAVRHQPGIDPGPLLQLRHMTAALERHGVPDLTDDDVPWIDLARTDRDGLPLRPVQYNGGAVLPPWLMVPRERPRIAVTVGTIVPRTQGVGVVVRILSFAAEFDADFVLAMEPRDSDKLGTLPANVRAGGWLPMNALLPHCAAVVQQGGVATTP